jgi:hypothetical protein
MARYYGKFGSHYNPAFNKCVFLCTDARDQFLKRVRVYLYWLGYVLGYRGSIPGMNKAFYLCQNIQTGTGAHLIPCATSANGSSPGWSGHDMKLTTHINLGQTLRRRGAIPPLPVSVHSASDVITFTLHEARSRLANWMRVENKG